MNDLRFIYQNCSHIIQEERSVPSSHCRHRHQGLDVCLCQAYQCLAKVIGIRAEHAASDHLVLKRTYFSSCGVLRALIKSGHATGDAPLQNTSEAVTFKAALDSAFSWYSATSPLSSASCLYSPALHPRINVRHPFLTYSIGRKTILPADSIFRA